MAKKTKVVELNSVPTEPQRGAGQNASSDDPVTIYYPSGGIARLIGSLAGGDEDEAVIKTGGTIVEHDINVRYAAPEPTSSVKTVNVTIVNNTSEGVVNGCSPSMIDENGYAYGASVILPSGTYTMLIPAISHDEYTFDFYGIFEGTPVVNVSTGRVTYDVHDGDGLITVHQTEEVDFTLTISDS